MNLECDNCKGPTAIACKETFEAFRGGISIEADMAADRELGGDSLTKHEERRLFINRQLNLIAVKDTLRSIGCTLSDAEIEARFNLTDINGVT